MTEGNTDELYMMRALELAALGSVGAHPNPMVGAVIVRDGKIIGEGYHRKFGEAHAEVNAINSVTDRSQLRDSRIYVTLEPCAHYGKTPPCADLIVRSGIPEVIVGTIDPFSKVDGRGINRLREAGIKVRTGVLEKECSELNKKFFTAHTLKRPYILLKWAQSEDGYLGTVDEEGSPRSYSFSTAATKLLVYKLRSEYDAIMVAAGTVSSDNPRLDVRHYPGRNPIKVVLDAGGVLSPAKKVFNGGLTLYYTKVERAGMPADVKTVSDVDGRDLRAVMGNLYERGITSVMVEGGATLLDRLLAAGLYDEIRVEQSSTKLGEKGYGRLRRR